MESSYITSAAEAHQLPAETDAELAFVGRSNCGKSSLLNALLQRTSLARTSRTPGRTQMANFFDVKRGEKRVVIVDLPGYGFSSTGMKVRQHWQQLMAKYFERSALRELMLLFDARRSERLDDDDLMLLDYFSKKSLQSSQEMKLHIVLTKSDKLNQSEQMKAVKSIEAQLKAIGHSPNSLTLTSTLKSKNIDVLRSKVLEPYLF